VKWVAPRGKKWGRAADFLQSQSHHSVSVSRASTVVVGGLKREFKEEGKALGLTFPLHPRDRPPGESERTRGDGGCRTSPPMAMSVKSRGRAECRDEEADPPKALVDRAG